MMDGYSGNLRGSLLYCRLYCQHEAPRTIPSSRGTDFIICLLKWQPEHVAPQLVPVACKFVSPSTNCRTPLERISEGAQAFPVVDVILIPPSGRRYFGVQRGVRYCLIKYFKYESKLLLIDVSVELLCQGGFCGFFLLDIFSVTPTGEKSLQSDTFRCYNHYVWRGTTTNCAVSHFSMSSRISVSYCPLQPTLGSAGDVFGEMALMLKQPRSATVVCSSPTLPGGGDGTDRVGGGFCVVNEIKGEDFVRMLKQSDSFLKSMKVIMRTRLFRQAWIRSVCFAAGYRQHLFIVTMLFLRITLTSTV